MEALLGASPSNPSCGSVADLQAQLRDLLSTKVTETRAEHVSVTFEVRATAVFDIPVGDNENEGHENASNIDPLLGGARASAAPVANANGNGNAGQATRRINAIDALINQPVDDPALQTSIARHIIASVAEVDGSAWVVRQVSRNEQSWTFTYACKDSAQVWNRQVSKTPAKLAIGEWSDKGGQDPVHLARPAFDCRGSIKIAFVKATKTVDVKYEHTPLHKTVGQLIDLLAPPPVVPLVKTPAKKPREPKPSKKPKPPREPKPKTPRSAKKRAGDNGPDGEGSQPKKRRKKKDWTVVGPDGTVLLPEMPGALPVGNSSARQLYNSQNADSKPAGSSSYPEGLVGAAAADGAVHPDSLLNLTPQEAARRREVAIKLLSDSNIDPKTLSSEQFNIFANQSPELQQDSLAMLVRYGAERLRIVHPTRGESSSGQSTPSKPNASASVRGSPQSAKPKKPRKKKSDVEGAGGDAAQAREAGGGRQSRRICDNCRIQKYKGKCDKARPACSVCVAEGAVCVYSPAKARQNAVSEAVPETSASANVAIPDDDEPDDLGSPGFSAQPAAEPIGQSAHEPSHGHNSFGGHVPEAEPVTHQVEPSQQDSYTQTRGIYQHSSGLTFPAGPTIQNNNASVTPGTASMEYMPNTVSEASGNSLHGFSYPQPAETHRTTLGYTEPSDEQGLHEKSATQPSAARRSLPVAQPLRDTETTSATNMDVQNNWHSMSDTPTQTSSTTRTSPRQARAKKAAPASRAYDDLRPQPASSWATANQSLSGSTQALRNSPGQTAAQLSRSKPRQNSRSQKHAPVSNTSTTRQVQPQGSQHTESNAGYESSAAQQSSSTQNCNNYDTYQSGNAPAESSHDRIGYQSYTNNQNTVSVSYPSFDSYNTHIPNAASSSQSTASSYPSNSATASNTAQWRASTSTPQARSTHGYNAPQSTSSSTASYNMSSTTPQAQSQSLQGFGVRPQPATQARSSPSLYSQQTQQPKQAQRQQQQQQQPQQQSYNGYMSQQQQHQQQQQQHTSSGSHQNWYGFGATSNDASSSYNLAAAAGTSHGQHSGHSHSHQAQTQQQQQQQQQRSMNLSSHTYRSMGDQALYDLLGNNQSG